MVSLRDADSMPAGVVRAYVSQLYQEVYDAACAARRPGLDVRVLLPPSGASGVGVGVAGGIASSSSSSATTTTTTTTTSTTITDSSPSPASYDSGGGRGAPPPVDLEQEKDRHELTVDLVQGWATREVAQLEPEVGVIFSDDPRDRDDDRLETINAGRRLAGYPELKYFSLESVASRAYKSEYFYAEDVRADIPTFSSVSWCLFLRQTTKQGHRSFIAFATFDVCESVCARARVLLFTETALTG